MEQHEENFKKRLDSFTFGAMLSVLARQDLEHVLHVAVARLSGPGRPGVVAGAGSHVVAFSADVGTAIVMPFAPPAVDV